MATPDSTSQMKTCTKCGEEYPATAEYFYRLAHAKDGLYPECRPCASESRYGKIRERTTKDGMKRCGSCKQWFPETAEHFHRAANRRGGLYTECRSCSKEYSIAFNRKRGMQPLPEIRKDGLKRCQHCHEWKPNNASYFNRSKYRNDGLSGKCKECSAADDKALYRANPEKYHERAKSWVERNQDRHRETRRIYTQRYRIEHSEQERAKLRRYREIHRDEINARRREQTQTQPEKMRKYTHNRRARLRNAAGNWTQSDIRSQVVAQTDKKGRLHCWWCSKVIEKYHIDHRIPLARGGSNKPDNLCLACEHCNTSKGAKLPHEWTNRLL